MQRKKAQIIERAVIQAISKREGEWLTAREIWDEIDDKQAQSCLKGLTQLTFLLKKKYHIVFRNRTGKNFNEFLCKWSNKGV